jgi:hypothetical protein
MRPALSAATRVIVEEGNDRFVRRAAGDAHVVAQIAEPQRPPDAIGKAAGDYALRAELDVKTWNERVAMRELEGRRE